MSGVELGSGPIMLAEHQRRILRAALERDKQGRFRWTTILWSCPKKSGKTRVAALVAAWLAATLGRYTEVYCLANDGKQSADRVLSAIKKANELGGLNWTDKMTRVDLPNGSFIEAVPVDPTGEAGANPTMTVWSEMWGFRLQAKERLWSEFTIPPTRYGRAIRWVESYAGYSGESPVLEQLYHEGVTEGKRHPDFPDLPVYTNDRARLLAYWDHEHRMPWQTEDYYQAEAALLHPSEFARIHRNEWVSAVGQAIPIESWDRCMERLPVLDARTPVVIGVDLSISGDCSALVVVSRHPDRHDDVAIRALQVWVPPKGGTLDYSATVAPAVKDWISRTNTVQVAFDIFQAHHLMTELRKTSPTWYKEFPQGKDRLVADKQFYDMVMGRRIAHDGDPVLREHVQHTAAKVEGEHLRFVKRSDGLPIDAVVAASMAAASILRLNV